MDDVIHPTPEWEKLRLDDLGGVILIAGAADVGKTTFARYLYNRFSALGKKTAFLDGDPGQSALGPPCTQTLALPAVPHQPYPPGGATFRSFTGSTSPHGHMLELLSGAMRLVRAAEQAGAQLILYDTCGLVDPRAGGLSLHLAEIDLLRPTAIFAIQRDGELESLLAPLRRSRRSRLVELPPSPAVRRRSPIARQIHRAEQYARYFSGAKEITIEWTNLAVLPRPRFYQGQIAALEDVNGYTLALAILRQLSPDGRRLTILTPLKDLNGVDALALGDVYVDFETFRDKRNAF